MRTGILGGTFNPPHLGHLHAAELAHRALNLDRVLFIPTNIPPHKATAGEHRVRRGPVRDGAPPDGRKNVGDA